VVLNVKDFGALGNGSANDTTAIQAALNAAGAAYAFGSREEVLLPAGRYCVGKQGSNFYCLSIPSGVKLYGPGCIFVLAGQQPQVRVFSLRDVEHVVVEGITVDGNSQNQTSEFTDPKKMGFFCVGARFCKFRGVRTINIDGDAYYFGKSSGPDPFSHHCVVEDVYADVCRRSLLTVTSGAKYIRLTGGYAKSWSGNQSACINIESDTDATYGCIFEDIYVDDPLVEIPHTAYSINLTQGHGTIIRRCRFPSALFIGASDDVTVEACKIEHPGTATAGSNGIHCRTAVNGARFLRNNIYMGPGSGAADGFHSAGIYVANTNLTIPRDVVIAGNRIVTGGLGGINLIGLAGSNVVRGNYVDCGGVGVGLLLQAPNNLFDSIVIRNNFIRNTGAIPLEIFTSANGAANGYRKIELRDNRIVDERGTPVVVDPVKFLRTGTSTLGDVLIDGNTWSTNVVGSITGLNLWRRAGNGAVAHYEGRGVPEGSIPAAVGSLYSRFDGGALTCSYVKESGTGATGWVAK
jgi:hypothetical protein